MSDGDKHTESTSSSNRSRRWSRLLLRLLIIVGILTGGVYGATSAGLLPPGLIPLPRASMLFSHDVTPGTLALAPFTVNLADTDASRFLRVSIHLVVDDEREVKRIEVDTLRQARVRSAVLELLTQQRAERLNTPDGKNELKNAIITRATAALQPAKVTDVLFADFVIQF